MKHERIWVSLASAFLLLLALHGLYRIWPMYSPWDWSVIGNESSRVMVLSRWNLWRGTITQRVYSVVEVDGQVGTSVYEKTRHAEKE